MDPSYLHRLLRQPYDPDICAALVEVLRTHTHRYHCFPALVLRREPQYPQRQAPQLSPTPPVQRAVVAVVSGTPRSYSQPPVCACCFHESTGVYNTSPATDARISQNNVSPRTVNQPFEAHRYMYIQSAQFRTGPLFEHSCTSISVSETIFETPFLNCGWFENRPQNNGGLWSDHCSYSTSNMRDYPSYFGHTYLVTPATQVPLSFTSQNEHLLAQHEGFPHSFAGHHTDISLGPENDAPCSSIHAMSDNYRGNRLNVANYSMDIPTILNTSLWITGLPFDVTVHELLQCIRGFGNIFALHLNRPEEGTGHFFSAAKLTFFKAEAAQRFLRSHERTGLVVGNLTASVRPNRIKVAEGDHPDHYSRVLVILRPADVTNEEWVSHQLSTRGIYWDTDDVFEYVHPVTGWVRLEFRFGSYRGQSSQAYRVLRGREARDRSIMVIFGLDPCASK